MIEIRRNPHPAKADIEAFWQVVWGEPAPPHQARILSRGLAHVGAYADGQLVGFINVGGDGGRHACIFDLGVHPLYRWRGIGSELLNEAIGLSRESGARLLHLDFDARLRDFFRRRGFEPVEAGLLRLY
jgi:GNAT superfamily N-acetyltransferase